ncbi:unnamed protein product [Nippostrongylus brasiliensis]|uniref:Tyrosine-protein phosphatase domain-containing protein n=1 Tax=Nippostrongylus brasiliensis TaxID=27835 RepID=A0A0N4YVD7_NIPBR|nr:unnamed protein product [Nippostrongylus brasiliensis]
MEEKKVRVVSLKWSTRFFLNVNETVAPRQYVENVTAACKRPKFCGEYYCNLNDYEFLVPDSVLVVPETQNRTRRGAAYSAELKHQTVRDDRTNFDLIGNLSRNHFVQ